MMDKFEEFDEDFDGEDADMSGLTPEEIAFMEDAVRRYGRTPDLTERFVHPITGEVIHEGGPDTPETRALRRQQDEWWKRTRDEPWPPAKDDSSNQNEAENSS